MYRLLSGFLRGLLIYWVEAAFFLQANAVDTSSLYVVLGRDAPNLPATAMSCIYGQYKRKRVTLVLTRTYRMQQMFDDILVCSSFSLLKEYLGQALLGLAVWAAVDLFAMQTLNASASSRTGKSPIDLCPSLGCA